MLDLGRASYRLRDDDNIYLDRFKGLLKAAEDAAHSRLQQRGTACVGDLPAEEIDRLLDPLALTRGGIPG